MNIFYLDDNQEDCAKYHVDKHVVKMILEYCQLLSTAHRVLDGVKNNRKFVLNDEREFVLYSVTHLNHPSSIWTRNSKSNYIWLYRMLVELCKEYTYRYDKTHKCQQTNLLNTLEIIPFNISNNEFTQPTPAMPEHCKNSECSIKSYRNYYFMEKQKLWSWKKREKPLWLIDLENNLI
jgi:hypothetical protein